MKILVTGAAGAICSHVAEALSKEGHLVVGVDCFSPYYAREIKKLNVEDIQKSGVEFREADLAKDDLTPLFNGVEAVYHFAAQPGISKDVLFEEYVRNNIVATHRLLEAARSAQIALFVFASTSSVYGLHASGDETTEPKPASYYGVTKLAGEQLALSYHRTHGLPVVVLRLFSVYGPRERPEKLYHKFIRAVLMDASFTLYEGAESHVRSYTYIGDVVRACLLVLKQPQAVGEIFNIGSDKTITTGEGMDILEKILGKKATIERLPKRAGDQLETAANIEKARRILGYEPAATPEEGLREEVRWYKEKIEGKF